MIYGFTGTQIGWSGKQYDAFHDFAWNITNHDRPEQTVLHHGNCLGGDANAHEIGFDLGWTIIVHPPTDVSKCAFVEKTKFWDAERCTLLDAFPYLERNGHIVDAAFALLATPKEKEEQLRSGTWATVRRAYTKGIPVDFFFRDGSTRRWQPRQTRIFDV